MNEVFAKSFTTVTTALALACICSWCESALAEETNSTARIQQPLIVDLSRAYGFCLGQASSMTRIQKEFPDLATEAKKAEKEFDLVFGRAITAIRKELENVLKEKWGEYHQSIQTQLQKSLSDTALTKEQASAFITLVQERSAAKIESPIVETLLSYDPVFQQDPTAEFARGFRNVFRTRNHSKSKGLDFEVEYPRSWGKQEGKRPNIIQLFQSKNGRGPVFAMIAAQDITKEAKERLSAEQIRCFETLEGVKRISPEFFREERLKQMVDGYAGASMKVTQIRPIVLDGWPAALVDSVGEGQRVDRTITIFNRMHVALFKHYMVFLCCSVAKLPEDKDDEFKARISLHDRLFWLMANSLVLQSQYRTTPPKDEH